MFDKFFDYNGDGQLDCPEKGARDAFVLHLIAKSMQESKLSDTGLNYDEPAALTAYERDDGITDACLIKDDFGC